MSDEATKRAIAEQVMRIEDARRQLNYLRLHVSTIEEHIRSYSIKLDEAKRELYRLGWKGTNV